MGRVARGEQARCLRKRPGQIVNRRARSRRSRCRRARKPTPCRSRPPPRASTRATATIRVTRPTWITSSSSSSHRPVITLPLTRVPLADPRSRMTHTPFSTRTSACARDTRVSGMSRRGALRPMTSTSSSSTRNVSWRPAFLASMRMSLSTVMTCDAGSGFALVKQRVRRRANGVRSNRTVYDKPGASDRGHAGRDYRTRRARCGDAGVQRSPVPRVGLPAMARAWQFFSGVDGL